MSELIDSDFEGLPDSDSIVAYQYSDLQKTARAILAKATATANNKIEQAKKNITELEEIMRKQGYDKGYAQGLTEGEAEGRKQGEAAARSEFEQRVGALNGILQHILGELRLRKQTIQAEAETEMLSLALEIARKIVKREVEVDKKFVMPVLMEAVALTNRKSDLVIRVNPEDHQVIAEEIPTLEAVFNDIGRVSITDDENIQRGGVRVSNREGEVDLTLEEQFAALEKALIGDIAGLTEWDGQLNTVVSQSEQEEFVPLSAKEVENVSPVAVAEEAGVPEIKPVEPKPKVEPSRRRRGPRNAPELENTVVTQNETEAATVAEKPEIPDTTTVHSTVDSALQSSLSGVSDLSGLSLDTKEEELIREVLESNVGEQNA